MNNHTQTRPKIRLPDDYQSYPTPDLMSLKITIDTEIDRIKADIDRARREAKVTGKYASYDWYTRAEIAKRTLGRQSQKVQAEVSRRKGCKITSDDREFVEVARRRLDPALFRDLWREALEGNGRG